MLSGSMVFSGGDKGGLPPKRAELVHGRGDVPGLKNCADLGLGG